METVIVDVLGVTVNQPTLLFQYEDALFMIRTDVLRTGLLSAPDFGLTQGLLIH